MLKTENITFEYFDRPIFERVSLQITAGQLLHIKGANGAGKSTLLRCLAGLISPTAGDITYQNQRIAEDISSYQQHLLYVGHKLGINLNLTPRENVQYNFLHSVDGSQVDFAIQQLNLQAVIDIPCAQLSMGQKRKTGLLRLCLVSAPIWLLDEPFVGLDAKATDVVAFLISNHVTGGGSVILTSHTDLPMQITDYQEYTL